MTKGAANIQRAAFLQNGEPDKTLSGNSISSAVEQLLTSRAPFEALRQTNRQDSSESRGAVGSGQSHDDGAARALSSRLDSSQGSDVSGFTSEGPEPDNVGVIL